MARIECPRCEDCLGPDWTGPQCPDCGGTGHITVRTEQDDEDDARAEDAWDAERERRRLEASDRER